MKVVIDVWNVHLNWWEDVAFAFESTRVMPMWRGYRGVDSTATARASRRAAVRFWRRAQGLGRARQTLTDLCGVRVSFTYYLFSL